MRFLRPVRLALLVLALGVAGCGDDDGVTPGADAGGGGTDGGGTDGGDVDGGGGDVDGGGGDVDGGGGDADGGGGDADGGGGDVDGGVDLDGGIDADGCVPPPCPAPPDGCRYVGGDRCTCGMLVCDPSDCGGVRCNGTQYCDYTTPYACGGDGTCMTRPDACLAVYMPVCGCDGATHGNACEAHAAGTDVAADGECAVMSDCRTAGCPIGQTCEACRGIGGLVYVCLPMGTAC